MSPNRSAEQEIPFRVLEHRGGQVRSVAHRPKPRIFRPLSGSGLAGLSLILAVSLLGACSNEDSADGADDLPDIDEPIVSASPNELAPAAADEPAPAAAGGGLLAVVIESHELSSTFISILVDDALLADPLDLEAIGRSYCEGRSGCRAVIWFDRTYLPLALPVDARQTEAAAFAYGIDIAGRETIQWNCLLLPEVRAAGRSCLPTTERLL